MLPRIGLSGRRGPTPQEVPWPPLGSGSTRPVPVRPDPRHAATRAAAALDATREHDACGVGFVAHASGARSHEVVSMALEAVARVAHRGAAVDRQLGRRRGPADPDPASPVLPRRLPAGPAPAARPAVRRRRLLPAARAPGASGEAVAMVEAVLAEDGIPFLGWRDVPTNPAALGPDGAGVVPGDPAGAGGPARPGGATRRRGSGRSTWRDERWSDGRRSDSCPASTPARSPAAPSSTRPCSPAPSSPRSSPTSAIPEYESADRGLPPALLDQHAAQLAAGPAVPAAGAQRRDQHALGQPQRDDHAAADAGLAGVGREDRAAARGHLARGQRLGQPGQRDGAAHALRAGTWCTRR